MTRAALKAQKDAFLVNNSGNAITPDLFNDLFENILDSVFLAEDDYVYPVSVETLNITSGTLGLTVCEDQVVGARLAAIADLSAGATLAQVIAKVNVILAVFRSHGLIST